MLFYIYTQRIEGNHEVSYICYLYHMHGGMGLGTDRCLPTGMYV